MFPGCLPLMVLTVLAPPSPDAFEAQLIEYRREENAPAEVFRYRLLKPAKVVAGEKYPLVLFLHGAGERGDDNISQLAYLPRQMAEPAWREAFPCFLIAPQCRNDKKWVEVDWGEKISRPQTAPTDEMRAVIQILEKVQAEYPVDPERIYLTGLSMGGYATWDLALRMPEKFAAVAPICGGGDEALARKLANTPIWAWHGDADTAVPVERSQRMIEAIRQAGGEPRYTELPGVGHNSWQPAYTSPDGLIAWMFKQRRKAEK